MRAMMLRLPGADGSPRDVDGSPLYESVEALERLVADRLGVEDAALRVRRCFKKDAEAHVPKRGLHDIGTGRSSRSLCGLGASTRLARAT